jgi:hypothetical protein
MIIIKTKFLQCITRRWHLCGKGQSHKNHIRSLQGKLRAAQFFNASHQNLPGKGQRRD